MKNLTMLSLASVAVAMTVGCGGNGTPSASTAIRAEPTANTPAPTGTIASAATTPETAVTTPPETDDAHVPVEEVTTRASTNGGYTLNVLPISPTKYSWGQKVQMGFSVTLNGKGVKGAVVHYSFSGQHHTSSGTWSATTGADGRVFQTIPLPSDKVTYKWLDLNASVDKYGLSLDPLPRILG